MRDSTKDVFLWLYKSKKQLIYLTTLIIFVIFFILSIYLSFTMKKFLIENSRKNTQELVDSIKMSIKELMILRNVEFIQNSVEHIKLEGESNGITGIYILDNSGKVIYTSEKIMLNHEFDRFKEKSCIPCHRNIVQAPPSNSIIYEKNGESFQRIVSVIYNEPACYGCHPKNVKTTGKLIIDRSMKPVEQAILKIQGIIVFSGIVCLFVIIIPITFLISRRVEGYISEIIIRNEELSLLYNVMGKLSKTIDFEELKMIVFEILNDAFDIDEADIIIKKENSGYRCVTWIKSDNTINRVKIDGEDKRHLIIENWQEGRFHDCIITDNRNEIYMPIEKNSVKMALIIMRRYDRGFDNITLKLTKAIRDHIAVAFENARLYYIAITDELTKLYTQRHFRYCIEREFLNYEKFGQKFALLLCDIDNFKKINDTLGHPVGDKVLYGVARTIANSIRDNDLAFRYGGEEFAIILPSTDLESAKIVAERIRENIEAMIYDKGNNNVKVTISIGCACCPTDAITIRELIVTADEALYCAKKTGKNKVVTASEIENLCKK